MCSTDIYVDHWPTLYFCASTRHWLRASPLLLSYTLTRYTITFNHLPSRLSRLGRKGHLPKGGRGERCLGLYPLMDRRFGVIYWAVVHTGTAKFSFLVGFCTLAACHLIPFLFYFHMSVTKTALGSFGCGQGGLGGWQRIFPMAGRDAHELLARDEPVDTGEGDSGDDDGELWECTRMYTPRYILPT
jgi:hypothetical protein